MLGYLASTLISLSIGTLTLKLSTTLLINVGVILSCSKARNVFNEIFEHNLRFPKYHIKNRTKISLNTFLALLHDRITPTLIRRVVDSFNVNVPIDRLIRVLARYPNMAKTEMKHDERYNERTFALNFLQLKSLKNIKRVK
jgi:hypothetical protein